jgi:hypothetical protein
VIRQLSANGYWIFCNPNPQEDIGRRYRPELPKPGLDFLKSSLKKIA